jgi:hypothetical protein
MSRNSAQPDRDQGGVLVDKISELGSPTRSYLPLVPLGVRESDLAILATWPNHVTHKIISTPPSLYVVYIVIQLHNYV